LYNIIRPRRVSVLDHLAERLAFMDRDAVAFVLRDLDGVADAVRSLGRELDRMFGGWQASLPDERCSAATASGG
jgi:hypothetical protein